jgi:hypothetical protein
MQRGRREKNIKTVSKSLDNRVNDVKIECTAGLKLKGLKLRGGEKLDIYVAAKEREIQSKCSSSYYVFGIKTFILAFGSLELSGNPIQRMKLFLWG